MVAIFHSLGVDTKYLTTIGYDVNAVAFNGRTGAYAEVFPIAHLARTELGHHQLPQQLASFFIQTIYIATIAKVTFVARSFVVSAHIHLAIGNGGITVRLAAKFGGPAHILGGSHVNLLGSPFEFTGVKGCRQTPLGRVKITTTITTPHGPVLPS